jgi:hypothetical protein
MRRAFHHSPHATSIPALEHYGVQVEGDSDEQHDVAVHGVIMEKVRDRQHDRNDTGQPVYGFSGVHFFQQSIAISAAASQMEIRVNPA